LYSSRRVRQLQEESNRQKGGKERVRKRKGIKIDEKFRGNALCKEKRLDHPKEA